MEIFPAVMKIFPAVMDIGYITNRMAKTYKTPSLLSLRHSA